MSDHSGYGESGDRDRELTPAEVEFMAVLEGLVPKIDFWVHADADETPWLMASLDFGEGDTISATLRADFDARGIRGCWSPSCLNWDDGVRAEEALLDVEGPDGIRCLDDGASPTELAQRAAAWFTSAKQGRWAY
ncbi:hypothetical protein VSH64_24435 [Amycolatopsis rhabdoformis]|uniref:Uncharacterized protein n=1 Tax=Amycolatopsis rhabdoformis TaxID=1448059 RepID=A0ABZ1HXC0_9PSEU|nr:hypothetical protein [Amycolatopsis rhabdoformis]WSE26029.1 hypothetical protein VSH64_24435 [Amycolatopsis rhabdoformis]